MIITGTTLFIKIIKLRGYLELVETLLNKSFPLLSGESSPHSWRDNDDLPCCGPSALPTGCLGLHSETHLVLWSAGADIYLYPDLVVGPGVDLLVEGVDEGLLVDIPPGE